MIYGFDVLVELQKMGYDHMVLPEDTDNAGLYAQVMQRGQVEWQHAWDNIRHTRPHVSEELLRWGHDDRHAAVRQWETNHLERITPKQQTILNEVASLLQASTLWIAICKARGDRKMLRRAQLGLEKGTKRPHHGQELQLMPEISERLQKGQGISSIHQQLTKNGLIPLKQPTGRLILLILKSRSGFDRWCRRHKLLHD